MPSTPKQSPRFLGQGGAIFYCVSCEETHDYRYRHLDTVADMVQAMMALGWQIAGNGVIVTDVRCPACSAKDVLATGPFRTDGQKDKDAILVLNDRGVPVGFDAHGWIVQDKEAVLSEVIELGGLGALRSYDSVATCGTCRDTAPEAFDDGDGPVRWLRKSAWNVPLRGTDATTCMSCQEKKDREENEHPKAEDGAPPAVAVASQGAIDARTRTLADRLLHRVEVVIDAFLLREKSADKTAAYDLFAQGVFPILGIALQQARAEGVRAATKAAHLLAMAKAAEKMIPYSNRSLWPDLEKEITRWRFEATMLEDPDAIYGSPDPVATADEACANALRDLIARGDAVIAAAETTTTDPYLNDRLYPFASALTAAKRLLATGQGGPAKLPKG